MFGPYRLLVTFSDGRILTLASGHNPQDVRRAEQRVSRNPNVIARVELVDLTGPLETIWDSSWK